MPIHDWSRVDAGIFHDFHHAWIEQIKRLLNSGVLPPDHYAMAEQHTSHFGPDVLTLHLLILDLIAPTRRDPNGIHGAIWEALTDKEYKAPPAKPLTLAAYEAEMGVRAFVEAAAVGDALPEMPLFLKASGHVPVAVESTYESAWEAVPLRWRSVIEG